MTTELGSSNPLPEEITGANSVNPTDESASVIFKPVSATQNQKPSRYLWVLDILFIVVLLSGAYLRSVGLYWGEYQYLHPDERFLVWVGTDISPVKVVESAEGPVKNWMSISEYFDTANSSMNPNNRGHGFYVYGTLPMFITRYAVEWFFGHSGFDVMTKMGRALSALTDLLVVLLVYVTAARAYDKRVALLAAAFSAVAVLQIQQSHFFTMDTFSNLFAFLSIYLGVRIMSDVRPWEGRKLSHPLLWPSIAFGLAYGAAMASKISIVPIALILPAAVAIRISYMPRTEWMRRATQAFIFMAIAGVVSLIVFRLAQPYAFSGPGLLGLRPNPEWMAQIREQRSQATRDVDFPPAMQWARRPIWYSFEHLTVWGLGLPLGLLAWFGFLWAGWDMLKGKWRTHILLWGWTVFYFVWQSLAINPTMRYQLPIYPTLVIFAAWGIIHLWDIGKSKHRSVDESAKVVSSQPTWKQIVAVIVGGGVLILTALYAVGFTSIYTRQITRIEGSRWIYQNVPGPINLHLQTDDGMVNQPLPFPYNGSVMAGAPYVVNFQPQVSGKLSEIFLPYVRNIVPSSPENSLGLTVSASDGQPLTTGNLSIAPGGDIDLADKANPVGLPYTVTLDEPIQLEKGKGYNLRLETRGNPPVALLDNRTSLRFATENGELYDYPAFSFVDPNWIGLASTAQFTADKNGVLTEIFVPAGNSSDTPEVPVRLALTIQSEGIEPVQTPEVLNGIPTSPEDTRGSGYIFQLTEPLFMVAGQKANIVVSILENQAAIGLKGAGLANEGDWDDGMPLRIDGYDGFGGIYPLDLNFNMYWDDNPDKLERFLRILDESDYVVITSNRQWGSLTRIPERFPMTTIYYRNLLGCPPEQDILSCYRTAKPGMFEGQLGFELVQIFQSDPQIGPLRINDQSADEAFTVYDHPKVLIFRKTADYDPQNTREILGSVDFSKVIRLPPMKFTWHPADLMLPLSRWIEQQRGGVWSEIFNTQSVQNQQPFVGAVIWYLALFVLGLFVYPILRLALPGLSDRGYPLARTAGLLGLSYFVWLAGSYQIPFTRTTISIVLIILLIVGVLLGVKQRKEISREWRENKAYFLMVEALFLAFFLFDLLIRYGNPDIWHPYKGGEKPMDFSYFNAVLKSTSFPPYDPWFAGGYLNYYYYGFVFVGVLVKWLGIVPSIAFNLILPTAFALIAMGAFSIAWNIYIGAWKSSRSSSEDGQRISFNLHPLWVGLAGALGMALLGNLGTVKMIYEGYQRLVAPASGLENSNIVMRFWWAFQGFLQNVAGTPLPYGLGDWYWNPSRAIPSPGEVEPITEFPFFTVLYADPHAHLFALPIALLALGFVLSIVLARGRWKGMLAGSFGFLLGGLAIGALRPTNTWDFYTYLALGVVAIIYTYWRYYQPIKLRLVDGGQSNERRSLRDQFASLPETGQRLLVVVGGVLLLVGLSAMLYQPFMQWYGQGYNKIDFWQGLRTPLKAYLTHWGLFLFVIVSWLVWETRDWLANTPVSAVHKLKPYRGLIIGLTAFLVLLTIALAVKIPQTEKTPFGNGVSIALIALPLAAWAGILLLRSDQPDAKRFALFLIGTGLVLTLMVEVIVLVGDIGRMNTVFKFYLQVWTFFAVCAAAGLGWLLNALPAWSPGWRRSWSVILALLIAGAALYPLTAGRAKILDRMSTSAPRTLDGLLYMAYSTYDWQGVMDLSQDYRAIRWLQENVGTDGQGNGQNSGGGSPVIVEANLRDLYRWGSRYTIYTGLPGVVGWEWHQQQQRALTPGSWVSDRISEIDNFYNTTDLQSAREFLKKYGVQYIILGQLERNHYPGPGLAKFDEQNGILWDEVFRDGDTVIYRFKAD